MFVSLIMIDLGPVCKDYIVDQDIFLDIVPVSNVFLVDQDIFLDLGPVCSAYIVDHNRHWTSVQSLYIFKYCSIFKQFIIFE